MDAANLEAYESKLKPFTEDDREHGEPSRASHNNKNISLYIEDEVTLKSPDFKRLHMTSGDFKSKDLLRVAKALAKAGIEKEIIEEILVIIDSSPSITLDSKEVPEHIPAILNEAMKRERNISDEVRDFVMTSSGFFLTSDVFNRLQVTSRQDKKNVVVALLRLQKECCIERHGQKDGCYRRIDREIEFMDFANADVENCVDIRLPLRLHTKTKIFPKGVVVIAGVSGMGKTLFSFNAIAENMGKFPIFYFNSEMGPEALKMKLSYFPIPISEWSKNMKVIDHWDFNNIADKIQPDAFNVIDYLEPEGDSPYNIHGVISAIIRRLNKGTALIAIQKKPGATMGTGGIYSIKAATLALALDWGKIEIIKNRFREADTLPSLNKINFEVHQGHKFVSVGGWYK